MRVPDRDGQSEELSSLVGGMAIEMPHSEEGIEQDGE